MTGEGWHMVANDEKVHQYFTRDCAVVTCDKPLMRGKLTEFRAETWDFFVEIPLCKFHLGYITGSADTLTTDDDEGD